MALLAATDQALGPDPSADAVGAGLGRYRLLASAIAGRTVEVASGTPHEAAWTDGSSIFVDPEAQAGHLLASVVVQAALLGAGSLDRQMIAALVRRPTLARRYLAVEGHRALAGARGAVATTGATGYESGPGEAHGLSGDIAGPCERP